MELVNQMFETHVDADNGSLIARPDVRLDSIGDDGSTSMTTVDGAPELACSHPWCSAFCVDIPQTLALLTPTQPLLLPMERTIDDVLPNEPTANAAPTTHIATLKCTWPGCKQSAKEFSSKVTLHGHMNIHRGISRSRKTAFTCTVDGCTYTCSSPSDAERHMNKHTTEKKFKCKKEGCEKSFKWDVDLNTHIAYDHNNRPMEYVCAAEDCDKAFRTPSDLESHSVVHTGERNFICTVRAPRARSRGSERSAPSRELCRFAA